MKEINSKEDAVNLLKRAGVETVRSVERYSFGDRDRCRKILRDMFLCLDNTVTEEDFVWLPEYELIADWMSDTRGKGLILMGDCGRGKSTIALSIIPVLFMTQFNKVIKPFSAKEMNMPDPKMGKTTCGWLEIAKRWSVVIDELGTENKETNFNEPYEPFCNVIDECEKHTKLLILTTNMTDKEIIERYGVRSLDRLIRLCRRIDFKGESHRK